MEGNNSRARYYHLVPKYSNGSLESSVSNTGIERHSGGTGQTGLGNSGNTCYMNCILQCLCNTTPLVEYFITGAYADDLNRGRGELSNAFSALVMDMWLGDCVYIFPDEVKRVLGKLHASFSDGTQQDAQELLLFFLNVLHNDLKRDCLRLFFKEEVLSSRDQPFCSFCGRKQDQTESIQLLKAPDIIIIHLKRFESDDHGNRKLTSTVTFPLEDLDLSQYTTNPSTQQLKYHLYAVVNHTGTLDSGHYTAYCKNPVTQNWHEFNDAKVTSISEQKIQSPAAYVLFYNCVNFQWAQ
ncbi:ubiquitin carboxyl-terminal hydrolase 8-like isoform X4 [Rhincodon typus]|uniref:ubiquitin carboxyl-terminal hydrolase 8-like isoform X4 n=1 Tax=Rhincodon typus TaxID=259920 RepID=UPI00202DEEDB|nr:ubiquitin carboxyl-terminal hydrolase 8-like isoform X4 [Rhincodon typus]